MRPVRAAREVIATGVVRPSLADPDGASLPAFEPGAQVERGFGGMTRRSSLTSSPDALDTYEL